jgi:hypothetical protein
MPETESRIHRELHVRRALATHALKLRRSRRRAGAYLIVTDQNRPVYPVPAEPPSDATLDEVEVYAWRLAQPYRTEVEASRHARFVDS